MAVDRNLFLYDLAVVAIMKNEGSYAKEWLDYHLLAGVNHFYIYDNESPDNLKEVLQPYIEKNIVTYIFYPGKARQYEAYNDAAKNFRFSCRYMAFIDADEFIFPQKNQSIVEVLDEVLSDKPNAGGLGINNFYFGSNYQEKADLTRGVLERFTRRNSVEDTPLLNDVHVGVAQIKTITIPRKIDYFYNPHFAHYYENFTAINSNGVPIATYSSYPPTVEKIVMNHYRDKSHEEYFKNKVQRGTADAVFNIYKEDGYSHDTSANEVFDDSILKYRDERKIFYGVNEENFLGFFAEKNKINNDKLFNVLMQNLSPLFAKNIPREFLLGKMETFLTCRAASVYLRENIMNENAGNFFEEMSLQAIYFTMTTEVSLPDIRLLIDELPKILKLKYPVVKDIRKGLEQIIPQILNMYRVYDPMAWKKFVNLKYLLEMLQIFDEDEKK
ncbi:MAG: glycosyltransferase family 92 protein [Selenomonadaceae bacterium]|nr:glycosyltransferase family 92 protein [Selenomonadaceae bacterium]